MTDAERIAALEEAVRAFLALEPDLRGSVYVSVAAEEACAAAREKGREALED